jgi:hypothetical protein
MDGKSVEFRSISLYLLDLSDQETTHPGTGHPPAHPSTVYWPEALKHNESIMEINHTNHRNESTDLPDFSCEPARPTHAKAFWDTARALKKILGTVLKLIWEFFVLAWKFIKLAGLFFWEIKGRCWWSIARDFCKKGYRAVKKDAFNG